MMLIGAKLYIDLNRGLIFELFILSLIVATISGLLGLFNYLKNNDKNKSNKLNKISRISNICSFIIVILFFSEVVNYSIKKIDIIVEICALIYFIQLILLLIPIKKKNYKNIIHLIMSITLLLTVVFISLSLFFIEIL